MSALRRLLRVVGLLGATMVLPASGVEVRPASERPVLSVALRPQVEVRQSPVLLDHVADLRTVDLKLLRRAMALPLGAAPTNGEPVLLDRDQLQRWVQARLGLSANQIGWTGGTSSSVRASMQWVSGQRILDVARPALQAQIAAWMERGHWQQVRISLDATPEPEGMSVPEGLVQLVARPIGSVVPARRMLVWVDLMSQGRLLRSVPVRFETEVVTRAAVAGAVLPAGRLVDVDALQMREVDLAATPVSPTAGFLSEQDVRGQQLRMRRNARTGDLVSLEHVQPLPQVMRGQPALLVASRGGMAIETRVDALEDGRIGQEIQVRQRGANAVIIARVIGPDRLEVLP